MRDVFPEPIRKLPKADIPLEGVTSFLSQGGDHQILFNEYAQDAEIPEHSHESQWGVVLEGKIDFTVEGCTTTYHKGDRFFLAKGVKHSSKVYGPYADIIFFGQKDRFAVKSSGAK